MLVFLSGGLVCTGISLENLMLLEMLSGDAVGDAVWRCSLVM